MGKMIKLQNQCTYGNFTLTGIFEVLKEILFNGEKQYLYIRCIDSNCEFLIPSLNDNYEEFEIIE